MKKWTPKVYKGQLRQPTFFDLTQGAKLLTRTEKDKIADLELETRLRTERDRLWTEVAQLLFAEYGIKSDDDQRYEKLARAMAFAHVPAMQFIYQPHKGRGAPKKWHRATAYDLWVAVHKARREIAQEKKLQFKDVHVIDCIRRVIKRYPNRWTARGGGKISDATLHKRYNEASKKGVILNVLMGIRPDEK